MKRTKAKDIGLRPAELEVMVGRIELAVLEAAEGSLECFLYAVQDRRLNEQQLRCLAEALLKRALARALHRVAGRRRRRRP